MVYAKDSANHRGTQKLEEAGDVSLQMNRSSNDSAVKFAETDGNGSYIDGDVGSDFEWKVARKMSDELVTGRVPPDKRTADSGEANDEEAAEERKVERRKDGISVGEYCCSEACANTLSVHINGTRTCRWVSELAHYCYLSLLALRETSLCTSFATGAPFVASLSARQVCCVQRLHRSGYSATAAVLRDAMKYTPSLFRRVSMCHYWLFLSSS
jgi:hypothetical protein